MSDENATPAENSAPVQSEAPKEAAHRPEPPPLDPKTSELLKDFSEHKTAPISEEVNLGDFVKKFKSEKEGLNRQEEINKASEERNKSLNEGKEKKQSFTERILNEKKSVEKKTVDLEQELKKYKEEEIPSLNKKIEELESRIGDSGSKSEIDRLSKELSALTDRLRATEEDKKKVESQLYVYDIQKDPVFIDEYIRPIEGAYQQAARVLHNNEDNMRLFHRALNANKAALESVNPKDRARFESDRDEYFGQIFQGLNDFQKGVLSSAFSDFVMATEKHSAALNNHSVERKRLEEKRQRMMEEEKNKIFGVYKERYSILEDNFKSVADLSDEEKQLASKLNLDYDTSKDADIAIDMISPESKYSVDDMCRVLHQGRAYKALNTKIKVLQHLLDEKDQVIKKMKGAGPRGGDTASASEGTPDLMSFVRSFKK